MKIYLDDDEKTRPTPDGWTRARTAEEIFELIKEGKAEEVSLDNDLGSGYTEGRMVMRWLEELVLTDKFPLEHLPQHFTFHTHNGNGQKDMIQAWKSIRRYLANKEDAPKPSADWVRLRFFNGN